MYFKIILIALIVFACLIIAYPETRLGLKELIKKHPFLSGSLLCLVLVIITFLYFPPLFRLVAIDFWEIPLTVYKDGTVEVVELADLGSIGDIFGSLNSFISSIALCAVAFSAWLQVKSLKETRIATKNQLAEVRNTRLTDQFYSLMTFKNEMLYQLNFKVNKCFEEYIEGEDAKKFKNINAFEALKLLSSSFKKHVEFDTELSSSKYNVRLKRFENILNGIFAEDVNELISYFYIYGELIKLVERAEDDEELRETLKSVLRNTMLQEEQLVLFWFASIFKEINSSLENSELFNKFHYPMYQKFALKFHKESHFKSKSWKEYYKNNATQPELGLFD